jgi:hypothetical protein
LRLYKIQLDAAVSSFLFSFNISQHGTLLDFFELDEGILAHTITNALLDPVIPPGGSEDMMHHRMDRWIADPLVAFCEGMRLPVRVDRNRTDS